MARSHMRRREVSPMFTQSETAPMVQKRVLLPTAPKMKARMKAPPVTNGTSAAGLASIKESLIVVPAKAGTYDFRERRFRSNSAFGEGGEALLGARGGAAFRVPVDEVFEGLLRVLALAHGFLRARDREHRVGRLFALRPGGEELPLRGDRLLVIAAAGIGHADPVLGVRRELARRVGDEKALHRRDGERVVAELELVERRLG